ncbi:MAG TPA: tetratricopeptide repeat protein [Lacunisphaera sp.]|jgi:tetratricopeptide (TPR) repeat protein
MKKRPILSLVGSAVIIAAVFAAWWWLRAGKIQSQIVAVLPASPDVSDSPARLRDELSSAEAEARSRFHAYSGLVKLSRLYHANGFLNEAAQCYTGLEALDPSQPRWPHLHATILAGFGEIDAALALWQRVVTLDPKFIPAQLRLGDCQLKSNRPDAASATYSRVLTEDPPNSYALLGLARLDYEAGRWEKAQQRLETVVQQTNYTLGYDLIVTLYEKSGQTDRARAIRASQKASGAYRDPPDPWLDDLMDVCYDPYRLALSAGFIARNGNPAQAVQLLQRAIELAPDDVSSRFQLGTLSIEQKNFPVAREQLERCTRLAPGFADGWAQLSGLQTQLGETSAAASTLAAGLAHCPDSPGLHLMHARSLLKAGSNSEAIAEFRESIRLRPNEADAYIELANFLINLGRVDEAVRLLEQSLEAEPGNPMAISTLAFHAITTGDELSAQRWMAKVRNQPRVAREQAVQLRAAYEQQFGHPFR